MSEYHDRRLATDAGGTVPVPQVPEELDSGALVDVLDRIAAALAAISTDLACVSNDLRKEARARRRLLIPAAAAFIILLTSAMTTFSVLRVAHTNERNIAASKATGDLLLECTTPSPVPPPAEGPDLRDPKDVNECAERIGIGRPDNSAGVRAVNCVALLLHGHDSAACTPEKEALAKAGIRLP